MSAATFVRLSKNAKIGDAAATYSATATCPPCPLKDGKGCYAEDGNVGFTTRRLNKAAQGKTPLQVARDEARAIDAGRPLPIPLRLHVSGDCRTLKATEVVAAAAGRYRDRGGDVAWTYTHAWRRVPRKTWGRVSALASCDRPEQAVAAREAGYAPAVTVARHLASATVSHGVRWIACPAQLRGVTCVECRLCMDADKLFEQKLGIAFAAHGTKERKLQKRLPVLG